MLEQRSIQHTPLLFVLIILMVMVLVQVTTDQYLPSLPAITKMFHTNQASIQLTLSFFMFGLSISHVFYGPLSDKIGRKPPLIFGVGLSILGSLCCFLSPSVGVLIFGRFLQGLGIGCCSSVGRIVIRDLFTGRFLAQVSSYAGMVSVFVMVASPTLGGYIQEHFDWRANFLFLVVFGAIIWLLLLLVLPETNTELDQDATKVRVIAANYWTLLCSKVFLGYALCACFALAGLVSYFTIAPFLFQDNLGLTPIEFGQLSIFIAGSICVSGIVNSQLVMRKGISFMVFIGVFCMIIGGGVLLCFSLLGVSSILSIMIPVSIFSAGAGFTFMNAFAGAFHSIPKMAGTAGALYASMQDLSASMVSAVIAAGKGYGQLSLAVILLFLGLSAWLSWYYLADRECQELLSG